MPVFIMKVNESDDWYCEWSTIVDNVHCDGTRAEMLAHLHSQEPPARQAFPGSTPEDRLTRADETGTSAMFFSPPFEGAWSDPTLMVEQRGMLPRDRLGDYLQAHFAGDRAAEDALLVPFEDDDE